MQNPKLRIIVLASTVLIQALLSFVLIKFVFTVPSTDDQPGQVEQTEESDKKESENKAEFAIGEIYPLEDIVINPAGTRGRRFISLSLGLELNPGQSADEVKRREPKLVDSILTLLSEKGLSEYIDTTNREIIREQILETIQQTIPAGIVKQVYITRFIIQ
ncbi:flagellar basal body-associated FliL family protein [candidate division KSB1 bacterium]|nr:flagellar basal body-associated FliL family protein [candidate division KSB1 bacterium]